MKLWDTSTGENTFTLEGHTQAVWSVALSPDGKQLASGSSDGTAKVWDVATGQETLGWEAYRTIGPGGVGGVSGVTFSLDRNRLFTTSLRLEAKAWDLTAMARTPAHP